jgi:hypothetical protein
VSDHFLVLGGHATTKADTHTWFYPAFSFHDYGPLDSAPGSGQRYGFYGKEFWCLPFSWYANECLVHAPDRRIVKAGSSGLSILPDAAPARTNAPLVRTYTRRSGTFPFWSYSSHSTPAEGSSNVTASVLMLLYDYKHEIEPQPQARLGTTNDYTRARVFWRLWHYERLNGNVSVDVFPAFTYDRKTDGFKKTSFLWRFFRYEHAASGAKKLDVLFIPVKS